MGCWRIVKKTFRGMIRRTSSRIGIWFFRRMRNRQRISEPKTVSTVLEVGFQESLENRKPESKRLSLRKLNRNLRPPMRNPRLSEIPEVIEDIVESPAVIVACNISVQNFSLTTIAEIAKTPALISCPYLDYPLGEDQSNSSETSVLATDATFVKIPPLAPQQKKKDESNSDILVSECLDSFVEREKGTYEIHLEGLSRAPVCKHENENSLTRSEGDVEGTHSEDLDIKTSLIVLPNFEFQDFEKALTEIQCSEYESGVSNKEEKSTLVSELVICDSEETISPNGENYYCVESHAVDAKFEIVEIQTWVPIKEENESSTETETLAFEQDQKHYDVSEAVDVEEEHHSPESYGTSNEDRIYQESLLALLARTRFKINYMNNSDEGIRFRLYQAVLLNNTQRFLEMELWAEGIAYDEEYRWYVMRSVYPDFEDKYKTTK